jgi:NADH-quinone oxidoreductase subunit C
MATFEEIKNWIEERFGQDVIVKTDDKALQPSLTIQTGQIAELCQFLHQDERLYFDFLACLTGIDNGPAIGTMEVIYHLTSIPFEHNLVLKVSVPRNAPDEPLPSVPSVSNMWRTANWHEREAFDLVGITFDSHPDLRRILLPADWQGHPLRKDYQPQETYHGIEVKY